MIQYIACDVPNGLGPSQHGVHALAGTNHDQVDALLYYSLSEKESERGGAWGGPAA